VTSRKEDRPQWRCSAPFGLPANAPRPRGLLPVPPEVTAIVDEQEARVAQEHGIHILPVARQQLLDNYTLQYYYDDYTLAWRHTPQGVEVLGVGVQEIGALVRTLNQEQLLHVYIGTV
jgi:hypothetical protein